MRLFLTGFLTAANPTAVMPAARSIRSLRRRSPRIWAALLGGALAAGAAAWSSPAHAQQAAPAKTMKIAVVDLRRAWSETEEGLRVQSALKRLFESRQNELDSKQVQLQKDKESLAREIQANKTPKPDLEKKADVLQRSWEDFVRLQRDYQREMSRKENDLMAPILNKIMDILKRLAGDDGYDLIVDKSVAPFYRTEFDLTDRAIQTYNSSLDSRPKQAPVTPDSKTPAQTPPPRPSPTPLTPAQPAPTQSAPAQPTPAPTQSAPAPTQPAPAQPAPASAQPAPAPH